MTMLRAPIKWFRIYICLVVVWSCSLYPVGHRDNQLHDIRLKIYSFFYLNSAAIGLQDIISYTCCLVNRSLYASYIHTVLKFTNDNEGSCDVKIGICRG